MYMFFKDVIKTLNSFLELIGDCQNTTPIKWLLLQKFMKLEQNEGDSTGMYFPISKV